MTAPPDAPLPGWLLLVLLVAAPVYVYVRSTRHGRRLAVRLGLAVGAFFVVLLPAIAVAATQDLTCRDGGVLQRPDGGSIVVGVTAAALVALVALFWGAGGRPAGMAVRLAVVVPALLAPVAIVEVMAAAVPLDDYCDGLRNVLLLQSALALLVPVAAVGLGLAWGLPPAIPGRVPCSLVAGCVAVLLPVQAVALADRLPPDPLACVTPQRLAAAERDAVTMRGPDTDLSVAVADFDGDGVLDLAGFDASRVAHVLRNDGQGRVTAGAGAGVSPTFAPEGAALAGDLDGNGSADLVVVGSEVVLAERRRGRGGVVVLLNDGRALRARSPFLLPGDDRLRDVALGDLDGDGNVEVVVGEGGTIVVLWDRNGDLEVGPRLTAPAPADTDRLGQRRFALADLNGDGRVDILSWVLGLSGAPSYVVLHANAGGRAFVSTVVATVGAYFGGVAVADFDGDGDADVIADGADRRMHVLVNPGDGRFDVRSQPSRVGAEDVRAADVDADGLQDLVLSIGFISDVVKDPGYLLVRLNRGDFSFSDAQRLATPRTLLAVADLNGDRRPDFVVDQLPELVVLGSTDCRGLTYAGVTRTSGPGMPGWHRPLLATTAIR